MSEIDKSWHLTRTDDEMQVTEFELQLWRVFNGFLRWAEECERSSNNSGLDGYDLSILHIVRMRGRPKSIADIGKILNRTDQFNIQYSIKKLLKMELIEKSKTSSQRKQSTMYQITDKGEQNTSAFAAVRGKILIDVFIKDSNLTIEEMTKTIIKLRTIYDDAEQAVTAYVAPDSFNIAKEGF